MSLKNQLKERFNDNLNIQENISAQKLTTFAVGGGIYLLLEPKTVAATVDLLKFLHSNSLKWRILGAGSNIVIGDEGIRDIVVRLPKSFSQIGVSNPDNSLLNIVSSLSDVEDYAGSLESGERVHVFCGASYPLMTLSRNLSGLGLSGLEFAAGIPASIGGAVKMNAGAHGSDISSVLTRVVICSSAGELITKSNSELNFTYRHSCISDEEIVLFAEFCLMKDDSKRVFEQRRKCLEYRKQTQPLSLPSAGSVFKNPDEEHFAAQLIESVGLKGYSMGGVGFSQLHSNWLVKNSEEALAVEVQKLIQLAKDKVKAEYGIELKEEIIFWE